MSGERRDINAPLNVGDTYDVTVEDVGREGDGIARVEGFVVFVPKSPWGTVFGCGGCGRGRS